MIRIKKYRGKSMRERGTSLEVASTLIGSTHPLERTPNINVTFWGERDDDGRAARVVIQLGVEDAESLATRILNYIKGIQGE